MTSKLPSDHEELGEAGGGGGDVLVLSSPS